MSKSDVDQKNDSANTLQQDSTHFLLKNAQRESYPGEIQCLQNNRPLLKCIDIRALIPFLDDNGLIRVGGRLERPHSPYEEKHPIIQPGRHHMSLLLARYFHEKVFHQGRQFIKILHSRCWLLVHRVQTPSLVAIKPMCEVRQIARQLLLPKDV